MLGAEETNIDWQDLRQSCSRFQVIQSILTMNIGDPAKTYIIPMKADLYKNSHYKADNEQD